MYHSIVVAKGEQEVKDAVRELHSAGRDVHQIQILAHENAETGELYKPKVVSRVGMAGEDMIHTAAPLYRGGGPALRDKLRALGLSPSAIAYYEEEMAKGRIVIAVDERS
ncbi:general stress protein [Paenibacillus sp. P26]|nr:general stress protein [Paenibacillus sp. P26]UUZ92272.1 general stress protein [Paenibacillus sp. P25]